MLHWYVNLTTQNMKITLEFELVTKQKTSICKINICMFLGVNLHKGQNFRGQGDGHFGLKLGMEP